MVEEDKGTNEKRVSETSIRNLREDGLGHVMLSSGSILLQNGTQSKPGEREQIGVKCSMNRCDKFHPAAVNHV